MLFILILFISIVSCNSFQGLKKCCEVHSGIKFYSFYKCIKSCVTITTASRVTTIPKLYSCCPFVVNPFLVRNINWFEYNSDFFLYHFCLWEFYLLSSSSFFCILNCRILTLNIGGVQHICVWKIIIIIKITILVCVETIPCLYGFIFDSFKFSL